MKPTGPESRHGKDLSDRERQVLEAVVRTYVETAEPAGSRNVAKRHSLGVSAATVRNTMSDLEDKGYLFHPHTSAGRIPTDMAYRVFVDQLMQPARLTAEERGRLAHELDLSSNSAVDQVVRRTARVLSLLSQELGLGIAPSLKSATLERLDLMQVSSQKVLLVATIQSGFVRTVYVDLPGEIPPDSLVTLTLVLNERLAGLTLTEIRDTLPERLRDWNPDDLQGSEDFLNIFMQAGADLFEPESPGEAGIHLGNASVLAGQPEFHSGERLKGLIELTEERDLLAEVLGKRDHREGRLQITIGEEHGHVRLSDFTLVTNEYRVGGMKGVIGVIGPTRMPYEKVVAIVDYTTSLINQMLE